VFIKEFISTVKLVFYTLYKLVCDIVHICRVLSITY